MSYVIVWSPLALEDLRSIQGYIATDSPRSALRVAAELEMLAGNLSEMPGRGRLVSPDIRELVAGRYLLRYRIDGEAVIIVRLTHSAQSR
ncbi:MAG TPA: type II toxin-antitoxin system RelE/ParE family toxin [Phenylobacterium sp.]|jgi:toxin ParE1/3/4|uniref:type II toxin-antitoxin system RelE/ParE family toxin n=1 Tax=Phenylobacterium sp. TaxID=1871053 RepID=UPI002D57E11F|nr:type II toxin-antitoxin system RelE/ParE family toxin [Phenylobacterium sp.]HZZ66729.1 type II toxin-antitoxin system RelE/ParE family toxin [Phenylobacterium sp.]